LPVRKHARTLVDNARPVNSGTPAQCAVTVTGIEPSPALLLK
jgi:hypothetical protein